jgi:hypothetical protein
MKVVDPFDPDADLNIDANPAPPLVDAESQGPAGLPAEGTLYTSGPK